VRLDDDRDAAGVQVQKPAQIEHDAPAPAVHGLQARAQRARRGDVDLAVEPQDQVGPLADHLDPEQRVCHGGPTSALVRGSMGRHTAWWGVGIVVEQPRLRGIGRDDTVGSEVAVFALGTVSYNAVLLGWTLCSVRAGLTGG
jgi:hypothetical protein